MKRKNRLKRRFMSIVLCLALLITYIPTTSLAAPVTDSEVSVSAYDGAATKVADRPTVNDWHEFFGTDITNTHNAGIVWTDKSVFTSVDDYLEATAENEAKSTFGLVMDDEENNFLVALSTIASTKSVEGYSTLPTDTMLVLDLSASMISNQAVSAMIRSANDAITKLQELNANNRVGVVAYSGNETTGTSGSDTAEVILPIGRYTPGLDGNNRPAYLVSAWTTGRGDNKVDHTGVKVANGVTGTLAGGIDADLFSTSNAKDAEGGTYIQNGLYKAYEQFAAVTDSVVEDGIQAGTERTPVVVLLSDGAATTATTDYTDVGRSDSGNGSSNYGTPGIAFLTQLTAAWVSEKLEEKYGSPTLFYSLGLNVSGSVAAKCVLDPANSTATDNYWTTYLGLASKPANRRTMNVVIRDGGRNDDETRTISYTDTVDWSEDSQDYVTEYFPAANSISLTNAFADIVQQIVIQSLYYPTYVEEGGSINEGGFLTFEDYIGKNMEVKSVKGIQLGTKLYTGETLARMIYSGGMGTEENPTDVGNNLVWSVQKRLGIDSAQEARVLIWDAYNSGQLFYDPDNGEFGNYIGWYADAKGKYVGFWDGKNAHVSAVPEEFADRAVYAIKSYAYYDAVGEGYRKTDMMYATIRVCTTLKTTAAGKVDGSEAGDVRVIGRIPAALIPLVEYNIELNGVDLLNPATMTIEGADSPSRLIYEVGLASDVDLLDLAATAAESLDPATGEYVFYTNQWNQILNPDGSVIDYSYSANDNTVSYFSPSAANENYYYEADSQVFADTTGTPYTGENAPSVTGTYYHRYVAYNREGNGTVSAAYYYEPISEHVLTHEGHLEKRTDNGGNTYWVVLKGTLHHWYGTYIMPKDSGNHTGTIHVSDMPFVHDVTAGVTPGEFHVDSYLGNNGKLTVDPYEGIAITKTVDDTIVDKTGVYTFRVTAENATFDEQCLAIYVDAEGNRTESAVTFRNSSAQVSLSHGETVYILSEAMTGHSFRVEEMDGDGYKVGSVVVSGTAVPGATTAVLSVVADNIGTAEFVNTLVVGGDVVISKNVVSTITDHEQKEFTFTVSLSGNMINANDSFATVKSDGTAGGNIVLGDNTIVLKHGEYITVKDLPEGSTVSVTEADYSAVGFAADSLTGSAQITSGETKYITITNTYDAADTDPFTVPITVTKNLEGLEGATWSGSFRFRLQRYNGTSYENVGSEVTMDYPANTAIDLSLEDEVYEAAGTYSYRVIEIVDAVNTEKGIIYDVTPSYFTVTVSDDGEGKYYVSGVNAVSDAAVTQPAADTWAVEVTFDNAYRADGAAKVVLNIGKSIDGTAGGVEILPSGFAFALYETDEEWTDTTSGTPYATSAATGADGKTEISLIYDELTETGDHYYLLKELNTGYQGNGTVGFTEETYRIKISIANTNGAYSAEVQVNDGTPVSATADDNDSIAVAQTSEIGFENTYTPDPVTLRPNIGGKKILSGRDIREAGEFTFSLYETGSDFAVDPADQGISAQAALDGTFTFGDLTYDKAGTYYYVAKENIPAQAVNNKLNGVTYDTSEYHITVTVTPDNTSGILSATAVIAKDNTAVTEMIFRNGYVPQGTSVVIGGTKRLEGGIRKLQARAFGFELLDENGRVIRTAQNGTSADGVSASFTFGEIAYNSVVSDTKTDVYTYTVREKLPDGVTAQNNKLHGVVYDTNEYTVTVRVTDDGDGTLDAVVDYSAVPGGEVQFINAYNVDPTYIDLSGTKYLAGDDLSKYNVADDSAFYYELYPAKWDADSMSVVQDGNMIAKVTDDGTGSFVFDHDEIAALNFDTIRAYRFIIKELVPVNGDPLMKYDTSTYYVEVDVTDGLDGSLVAAPEITKVDGNGTSVVITDNDGSGKVNDDIDFHNELDEAPVTVEIEGEKKYNSDLTDGKFTFELYQALPDSRGDIVAVGDPVLTADNDTDGKFLIKDIEYTDAETGQTATTHYLTFSEAGTYYFVVKEELPEGVTDANKTKDGITYDLSSYVVTVTVTDGRFDGTGRAILEKEVLIGGAADADIIFENEYAAKAEEGTVISGKKTLTGKTLEDGAFTFELYKATVADDGTVSYGSDLLDRKSNVDGRFTFDEIGYESLEEVKTHYYVVKEQIPVGAGSGNTYNNVTYDTAKYLVEVVVEDNGDGTLKVSDPNYYKIGVDDKPTYTVSAVEFKNTYTEPYQPEDPEEPVEPQPPVVPGNSPKTGESFDILSWFAFLAVSTCALVCVAVYGRRMRIIRK